ncbi:MAG: trehalase-like domain-containing protein, partial [Acidimicrobiia bacterium]
MTPTTTATTAYPPIENHGLIGDLQTAALVSTEATVDWMCLPRFDSPTVFAGLLDPERGGHFSIRPKHNGYVTRQLYLPGTPILVTRFMTTVGVGEVTDFMPVTGARATDRHRLVRLIRVVRGEMEFVGECVPRFDYGRATHTTHVANRCVEFHSDSLTLRFSPVPPPEGPMVKEHDIHIRDGGLYITARLSAGQVGGVVLESAPEGPAQPIPREEILA